MTTPLFRITQMDHAAMLAIARIRHPLLTLFFRVLTWTATGTAWGIAVLLLGAGIYFNWIHFSQKEFILRAMGAPAFAWIFVQVMKKYWKRKRPFQAIEGYASFSSSPSNDSFPSGHTASVFAFWIATLPLGFPISSGVAVWGVLIAFSRFYLGVHFPTDILIGALIGSLAGGGYTTVSRLAVTRAYAGTDLYSTYSELVRANREGIDFEIEIKDRSSEVLVLAIHGGKIESGSDELAAEIAGLDWSRYIFRALQPESAARLHVTSTHYDDPRLFQLASKTRACISLHGYRGDDLESICLGGANKFLRETLRSALQKHFKGISLRTDCPSIQGVDPKNVVNRCQEQGVQLELSKNLRNHFQSDSVLREKLGKVIRQAVETGLKNSTKLMQSGKKS